MVEVAPVVFGPAGDAFGPEFDAGKQAVDVPRAERSLEERGVLTQYVVQGAQEERRDTTWSA